KEFVDAGGYRSREFWREPIVDDGRELSWDEAVDRFRDTTGRRGPAGWELGSYPEGSSYEPVGGVSWYEAAAFAAWAGGSLPTVFHWHRAAVQSIFSDIIVTSNFGSDGPATVGSYQGLGPWGTYDMAGNVREWCSNSVGDMRYILGGAWSEPAYMYRDPAAAKPLDRSLTNGFRCMRTDSAVPDEAMVAVEKAVYDFSGAEPVDDDIFEIFRGVYAYDPTDLDPQIEAVDDSAQHWRRETVTFKAAYGGERVPTHLFLPKNGEPPFQAVIFFPGGGALELDSSRNLRLYLGSFIMRSGRALIYPVYKGTFERRVELSGHNDIRDMIIHMSKDLQRTVDYLETREDIDPDKLAYYGLSMGANWGPIFTAIEDRFSASVLLAGGLSHYPPERPPESIALNFMPRSTVPVLMINADNDFGAPVETNIVPMFNLQGAPEEHKRLVIFEGGHVPESPKPVIREIFDWLDEYLGPVE
ncbi:MAG: SUMF1/EgtB/PvdO family nonheme iron enzyme, partial [Acidobacteria bacterium]|nr:SUMF1/EgtB/PvdO family nonheme iron enzyme [Acidobacteriota bacterium]